MEHAVADAEADITAAEGHPVDTLRIVVEGRTGILCEHLAQGVEELSGEVMLEGVGDVDAEGLPLPAVDEAAACIGMGVGIGDVGFDVVDGGAVHEVGSEDVDDGALVVGDLDAFYPDARQSQIVGTEGRPRGKDAYALVAAKTWRSDGETGGIERLRD